MVKVIRGVGWTLLGFGALVLLYLVYLLVFTNVQAERAQTELLEQFELEYGPLEAARAGEGPARDGGPASPEPDPQPPELGDAYAAIWFERPGTGERVVHADPLFVVEGVSLDVLKRGPGHYPDTSAPGQPGNFAVSGHRTTYGAPFYHLDELQQGDEIHVVDRLGREWVYVVRSQEVVQPTELWVVGSDPLGTGAPTMTLTTCTPRFSAAQRLIVFAELQTDGETSA